MQTELQFKMITAVKTVFDEAAVSVTLPTTTGEITVLPDHTALVTMVQPGELIVRHADGTERAVAVNGGIIEMFNNTLVVLADSADHPEDINIDESEAKAKQLAQDLSVQTEMDLTNYGALEKALAYENAKLSVAKKWRKL